MNTTNTGPLQPYSIHPDTLPGHVALTVSNLERQIVFYQQVLGLQLHWRNENSAGMGAGGADLLRMFEEPGFRRYQRITGLYHFAVVFPNRRELARAVARLFVLKVRNYPTDHIGTKTTYLNDPEGNGIELYAESPEDGYFGVEDGMMMARRADGSYSDGREALDLEALFSHLLPDDRLDGTVPPETRVGHVHLHVRDVQEAVDFYHGLIGFDIISISPVHQAAFISAGGYHHHLGLNTWQGAGAPPPPADALGLRYFSINLPTKETLTLISGRLATAGVPVYEREDGLLISDPSGNAVLLSA